MFLAIYSFTVPFRTAPSYMKNLHKFRSVP